LEDNTYIEVSGEHKILSIDGFIEAKNIKEGEKIIVKR